MVLPDKQIKKMNQCQNDEERLLIYIIIWVIIYIIIWIFL